MPYFKFFCKTRPQTSRFGGGVSVSPAICGNQAQNGAFLAHFSSFSVKNRVKIFHKTLLTVNIFGKSAQIWLNKLIIFSQEFKKFP